MAHYIRPLFIVLVFWVIATKEVEKRSERETLLNDQSVKASLSIPSIRSDEKHIQKTDKKDVTKKRKKITRPTSFSTHERSDTVNRKQENKTEPKDFNSTTILHSSGSFLNSPSDNQPTNKAEKRLGNSGSKDINSVEKSHRQQPEDMYVYYRNMLKERIPGDVFLCPPCNCTFNPSRKISVFCKNKKLYQIPTGLPNNTWKLSVESSSMKTIEILSLQTYSSLGTVVFNFNKELSRMRNTSDYYYTTSIRKFRLENSPLSLIDDRSFITAPTLEVLYLNLNKIQTLGNFTFYGLKYLKFLALSSNDIIFIEHGAFDHMKNLQSLDLSNNVRLTYCESQFSPRLFLHLKNLQELHIEGNKGSSSLYPSDVLQQLTNLQELTIDGIKGAHFGSGMKMLRHFNTLSLTSGRTGSRCRLGNITEESFENIPYIRSLYITKCSLQHISVNAFAKTKFLKGLSLSYLQTYNLYTAFEELEGLENSSLKYLKFMHLDTGATICRSLSMKQAKYLAKMPLDTLDLSYNRLALLQLDFTLNLPRSLKKLSLRGNKLTFIGFLLPRLAHLANLKILDVRDQNVESLYLNSIKRKKLNVTLYSPDTEVHQIHVPSTDCQCGDADKSDWEEHFIDEDYFSEDSTDFLSMEKELVIPPQIVYFASVWFQ